MSWDGSDLEVLESIDHSLKELVTILKQALAIYDAEAKKKTVKIPLLSERELKDLKPMSER